MIRLLKLVQTIKNQAGEIVSRFGKSRYQRPYKSKHFKVFYFHILILAEKDKIAKPRSLVLQCS